MIQSKYTILQIIKSNIEVTDEITQKNEIIITPAIMELINNQVNERKWEEWLAGYILDFLVNEKWHWVRIQSENSDFCFSDGHAALPYLIL